MTCFWTDTINVNQWCEPSGGPSGDASLFLMAQPRRRDIFNDGNQGDFVFFPMTGVSRTLAEGLDALFSVGVQDASPATTDATIASFNAARIAAPANEALSSFFAAGTVGGGFAQPLSRASYVVLQIVKDTTTVFNSETELLDLSPSDFLVGGSLSIADAHRVHFMRSAVDSSTIIGARSLQFGPEGIVAQIIRSPYVDSGLIDGISPSVKTSDDWRGTFWHIDRFNSYSPYYTVASGLPGGGILGAPTEAGRTAFVDGWAPYPRKVESFYQYYLAKKSFGPSEGDYTQELSIPGKYVVSALDGVTQAHVRVDLEAGVFSPDDGITAETPGSVAHGTVDAGAVASGTYAIFLRLTGQMVMSSGESADVDFWLGISVVNNV